MVRERWRQTHSKLPDEGDDERMFPDIVPLQLDCLTNYADLVPRRLDTVRLLRRRRLSHGLVTGYTSQMMNIFVAEAPDRGYRPDPAGCTSAIRPSRSEPWIRVQDAIKQGVHPFEAVVEVDDILPGTIQGPWLYATMRITRLERTGNEIGLNEAEIQQIDPEAKKYL